VAQWIWSGTPTEIEFGALNCIFKIYRSGGKLATVSDISDMVTFLFAVHTITEAKQ